MVRGIVAIGILAALLACIALLRDDAVQGSQSEATSPLEDHGSVPPEARPGPGLKRREAPSHADVAPAAPATPQNAATAFAPAPAVVRGVVLGPDGRPAAGMTVHMGGLQKPRTQRTDDQGRFRFDDVPPEYSPRVWAAESGLVPGGHEFGVQLPAEPGKTHDVELRLVRALTTRGRVVRWDGAPVAGARVWVEFAASGSAGAYQQQLVTQSAADGSFRIAGVPRHVVASLIELHAIAPGLPEGMASPGTTTTERSQEPRDPEDPVEIVLARPCFIDVVVVDEDTGAGVPDAVIGRGPYGRIQLARTTEEGRCRVGPVPPGQHVWTVHARGWDAPYGSQSVSAEASPDTVPEVTHRMFRTYEIQGRVVYEDGKPADDRTYGLRVTHEGAFCMATDIRGFFDVEGLRAGTYEIAVSNDGMHEVSTAKPESILGRAVLETGTTDAVIVLRGNRPVELEVVVRTADGEPLPVGAIAVRSDNENWNMHNVWEPIAFQAGRATLSGIIHPVWIEVIPAPGAAWARRRIGPIQPGTPSVEVTLEAGRSLSGVVLDERGEPAEGAEVWVHPDVSDAEHERSGWQHDHGHFHTGSDGAFESDRLWAGAYWVNVKPPDDYAPVEGAKVTAGAAGLEIRLHRRADLDLPILDAAGAPLPRAQVAIWTPPTFGEGGAIRAITDDAGIAHLKGVDPKGVLCLEVTPPSGLVGCRRLWLEDWRPAADPISLPAAWTLRGIVRNPDGTPAPGATVRLEHEDGQPPSSTGTDSQGRFQFHQLPFEPVRLTALAPKGRSTPEPVRVSPPTTEVELKLRRHTGVLHVQLAPWPPVPPPTWVGQRRTGFVVWSPEAPWMRHTGTLTSEGVVKVEGLDPSVSWSVFVWRTDRDLRARVDGMTANGSVMEARGTTVRPLHGRVRAPDQTWPYRVEVMETGATVSIEDDGSYEISGLPVGRWTLRASASRGRDFIYRTVITTGEVAPDIDFGAPAGR